MAAGDTPSDEALIAACATDPDAFAAFYRRHARPLAAYFVRRTADAELSADLTAETFAAALEGSARFDPARGPAVGWLYGIARNLLAAAQRRGRVEDGARRRLGMEPIVLDDEALAGVEQAGACDVVQTMSASEIGPGEMLLVLESLPPDQRDAVRARVLDERSYADIALAARTSESVVRQRVSRGLARLRARTQERLP